MKASPRRLTILAILVVCSVVAFHISVVAHSRKTAADPVPAKTQPLMQKPQPPHDEPDLDLPKLKGPVEAQKPGKGPGRLVDNGWGDTEHGNGDTEGRQGVFLQTPLEQMAVNKDNPIFHKDTVIGKLHRKEREQTVQKAAVDAGPRENATFFSLVRNRDFTGIMSSIESVEKAFNEVYHYDWVFANDEPFTESFKTAVSNLVSGTAHFVQVPAEWWQTPSWIDPVKAERTREYMKDNKIKYGASESYRHMCRFNSGFFYRLPVMQQYRYYWRVEPDIQFRCDLFETDWFRYMREHGKKYAFVLSPLELHTTVRNIWRTTWEFAAKHPSLVAANNSMAFLSDDNGQNYNMCHFWSNFEIGDMDWFRSEAYETFFDYFDKVGGFYYSRWGDAPVHSIAVSMLLQKDEVFYLEGSGYFHNPNGDCPRDLKLKRDRRCACNERLDHSWSKGSCIPKWYEINGWKPKYGEFRNQHKFVEGQDQDVFKDW